MLKCVLCASPRSDKASFLRSQSQLNINNQPDASNATSHLMITASLLHARRTSPHLALTRTWWDDSLIPISAVTTSNHNNHHYAHAHASVVLTAKISTSLAAIVRSGCVWGGIISQTCSPHLTGTDQLLSIWLLGGYTPSVLEGDITTNLPT